MSSVSGSDSSAAPPSRDEVRRNREEYRKNEAELVKKHAKELRRLNEQHAMEVENLKKSHDQQLEEVQSHARDTITDRDNKYQSEIENIRSMHRKQLQATTEEAQKREDLYDQTLKRESQSRKSQNDERVKALNQQYNQANKERDTELAQTLHQYREDAAQGMNEQREKLDKSYQKQLDSVREDRDRKVAELQGNFDVYHKYADNRLRDQQIKHMQDTQRASDSQMRALKHEASQRAEAEARWHNETAGGLNDMREHYKEAIEKNKADLEEARGHFQENYNSHVEPEMRELRNRLEETKDQATREARQADYTRSREKAQFRDAMSKNIENYKMQRDEAVRSGNERRARDIENLNERNTKELVETHRFYNQKMDDETRRLRGEYQNINNDNKLRNEQLNTLADARVKSVITNTEEEKQRMARQQSEAHDSLRRQQADQLRDLRADADAEKFDAIERIKQQAKQKETAHTERLSQLQQTHQRDILALQDQLLHERKMADENLRRTIEDLKKAHKTDLDQQMSKYEERIRMMQNTQSEELRRVNRANEEKLNQLAATVRKA